MLAVADSAFDFFVLQLRFHAIRCRFLLLVVFLPCHARSKDDILSHGCSIETWTSGVTFLVAKFRPGAPLRYLGVDGFSDDGGADAPSGFNLLPSVVETVGYASFGTVFVGGDLGSGEGGGIV